MARPSITFGHSLFIADILFHDGAWSLASKKFAVQEVDQNHVHLESRDQFENLERLLVDVDHDTIRERFASYNFAKYDSSLVQTMVAPVLGKGGATELEGHLEAKGSFLYETNTEFKSVHFNRISNYEDFKLSVTDFTFGKDC